MTTSTTKKIGTKDDEQEEQQRRNDSHRPKNARGRVIDADSLDGDALRAITEYVDRVSRWDGCFSCFYSIVSFSN